MTDLEIMCTGDADYTIKILEVDTDVILIIEEVMGIIPKVV